MNNTKTPRSLWPISITAFFIVLITCIVSFVAFAMRQREDLVSTDYYERAVRYEKQLDALNRSQEFSSKTVVTFDSAKQTIVIVLPEAQQSAAAGQVQLYRPSDARLDRELAMQLDATGVQTVDAKDLSDGLWRVRVKWKQNGQDYYLDQPVIVPDTRN